MPTNLSHEDPEGAALRANFRRVLDMYTGRWKLEIIWLLHDRMHRFGELRRGIPGISQHMLTTQLRELEADGLVKRTIYAEVPPRVEYEITPAALGFKPIFNAMLQWARENPRPSDMGNVDSIKVCDIALAEFQLLQGGMPAEPVKRVAGNAK